MWYLPGEIKESGKSQSVRILNSLCVDGVWELLPVLYVQNPVRIKERFK
jgi:hypothetical protein